jgi:hypothetical protein
MQSIYDKWHAETDRAIQGTAVPSAFVAGLIANETGGDPTKKRFEKGVLAQLWEVIQERQPHFGSLTADDVNNYCLSWATVHDSECWFSGCKALDALATSWGLTQIMGYEAIALGVPLATLQNPTTSLQVTCTMLKQFAKGAGLDVTKDFSELFDCWNTGRPHAPTADPKYIPNGLARLEIYQGLLEEPPRGISA